MAIAQRLLCVFLLLSAPCDGAKKYRRTPKQKPVAPPPPSAPLRAPPPAPEPRPPEAPPIEFNDDTRITDEETVEEYSKEYLEKEKIKKQASHFATQQLAVRSLAASPSPPPACRVSPARRWIPPSRAHLASLVLAPRLVCAVICSALDPALALPARPHARPARARRTL